MKIKRRLNEVNISRIWQHTKDDSTFAIVGSIDKDTGEDHTKELFDFARSRLSDKKGFTKLEGTYTYKDGHKDVENSLILYNIPKDEALKLAKDLNQESIIWKDKDFFGFLTADGTPDGEFKNEDRNMTLSGPDLELYGSRLAQHKNRKFIFELYAAGPIERSSVDKLGSITLKREKLFEFSLLGK